MPAQGDETRKEATADVEMTDAVIAPAKVPKTAEEAIKGLRKHQGAISKAARAACTVFEDIKAAKGSGMAVETRRELENEFVKNVDKTAAELKALNKYKDAIKEVAVEDKMTSRAMIGDLAKTNSLARLAFPPNDFDRAKQVAAFKAGEVTEKDFKVEALSALLRATMALSGAAPASVEAVKSAFTNPDVTIEGGAFEAVASVVTSSGGPVFVAGSELEQTHRAVGEELSSDLTAVASAEAGLAAALAAAEKKDEKKELPVRGRAPRGARGARAPRGGGRGGKKKANGKAKKADDDDEEKKKKGEEEDEDDDEEKEEKKPPGGGAGRGGRGGGGGGAGGAGAASGARGKAPSSGYEYNPPPRPAAKRDLKFQYFE